MVHIDPTTNVYEKRNRLYTCMVIISYSIIVHIVLTINVHVPMDIYMYMFKCDVKHH